jgi:outer membrane protein
VYLKLFLLLLIFFSVNAVASSDYSLRLASGKATTYDLGEILTGHIGHFRDDNRIIGVDGGYLLAESYQDSSFDIYMKTGLSSFQEGSDKDAIYEATLYLKAYWNIDFLQNRLRVGFGEGFSYTSGILEVEREDALEYNDNNSHFLNYLDVSVDFDFGRLSGIKGLQETYIGVLIKHRSGIFGLINNVRHGGSNYLNLYLEKNF